MKRTIHVKPAAPQYSVITNITFAQTDAWFGHTTQDLRMDLIYPEDTAHDYPCIVWICGGAWLSIDKSAHLAYLSELLREQVLWWHPYSTGPATKQNFRHSSVM